MYYFFQKTCNLKMCMLMLHCSAYYYISDVLVLYVGTVISRGLWSEIVCQSVVVVFSTLCGTI